MSDLWDDLKARGEEAIEVLCTSKTPESQTLEFKSKSDPGSPELNRADRQNLGKSLSAFSNAVGGIIIWGIAAEKRGEEFSAGKPDPIHDIGSFEDRVHGLVGPCLSPPNPRIELHSLRRPDGSGYLAINVRASDTRPHMSMAPDHHRYYLRTGSSTMPMPDFLVRDMLRVRTSPNFTISAYFAVDLSTGDHSDIALVLNVGNEGRVSAKDVYLSVERDHVFAWKSITPFSKRLATRRCLFEASALSLHPGQEIDAAKLVHRVTKKDGGEATFSYKNCGQTRKCIDTDLRFQCEIGCEDMPTQKAELLIPADEFEDAVDRLLSGTRRVDVEPMRIKMLH